LAKAYEITKVNLDTAKLQQQKHEPSDQTPKFKIGDLVLVTNDAPKLGMSRKLMPKYTGPYKVVEVLNEKVYRIDIKGEWQTTAVHRLKLFKTKNNFF